MNAQSATHRSQVKEPPSAGPEDSERAIRAVDRVISDVRRGLPVVVASTQDAPVVAVAAEQFTDHTFEDLAGLGCDPPTLAITSERAAVLHIPPTGISVAILEIEDRLEPGAIRELADPTADLANPLRGPFRLAHGAPAASVAAAVEVCKLAKLLPAAVTAVIPNADSDDAAAFSQSRDLLLATSESVAAFRQHASNTLTRVTSAHVPLAGVGNVEIIAFRPKDGGIEHLAIVIGDPSRRAPVLTRLHSECFTGDLLESLRCDCGTQLRAAVDTLSKEGGGVLLYLAQEGRGIGLINKLRAYRLQDQGFDTYDANERLGFEPDERMFEPAARMLRDLGIGRVRLLTNNPEKVAELQRRGIDVVARVPHAFPANPHNANYLSTKVKRAGHNH